MASNAILKIAKVSLKCQILISKSRRKLIKHLINSIRFLSNKLIREVLAVDYLNANRSINRR